MSENSKKMDDGKLVVSGGASRGNLKPAVFACGKCAKSWNSYIPGIVSPFVVCPYCKDSNYVRYDDYKGDINNYKITTFPVGK